MTNKRQIDKLRDNAELAWASYGYFHYFLEQHNKPDYIDKVHYIDAKDENGKDKLDNNNEKVKRPIELTDILDINYKKRAVFEYNSFLERYDRIGTLKGDFTQLQNEHFFNKYDVLIHQPNTHSGFSATLFGEKRKQTNTESKATQYTNDYGYTNYILAFRGTEKYDKNDLLADKDLFLGNIPKEQYFDMLL